MTTTVKDLIDFLQQYPEDASIYVTKEVQSAWSISTEVVELNLEEVEVLDLRESKYYTENDPEFNRVEIRLVAQ